MSQFENVIKGYLKDFSIGDKGQFCGFCVSEEEVEDLFTKLQCIGYSYSVRRSARKQTPVTTGSPPRLFFQMSQGEVEIPFFGLPFMVEYSSYRQCTLGPKYYDKEEFVPDHLADHFIPRKKRKYLLETKKTDCPATFSVKCVRVFPGVEVKSPNDRKIKKKVIHTLKQNLQLPSKPESFLRFYVAASPPDHHTHSVARMKASGDLHPRLVKEIRKYVENGTTSVKEIKLLLERFVETAFNGPLRPDRVNTMFYPTHRTIYNHVYKIRKAIFGQESLETQADDKCDCSIRNDCNTETNRVIYDLETQADDNCDCNIRSDCNTETNRVIYDLETQADDKCDCSIRSDCNTETTCVIYDVQGTSCNDERDEEDIIPEKSEPYSSLCLEARDICKRIMTLSYSCNHETIKKLVDDLKIVQCGLELSLFGKSVIKV